MIRPGVTLALSRLTSRAILRERAVVDLLVLVAVLVPASASFSLFAAGARALLLREMGQATLLVGGFLIVLVSVRHAPGEDARGGILPAFLVTGMNGVEYALGRFLGLSLVLALATCLWSGVFWATLALHDAGPLDLSLSLSILVGFLEVLALAAVLGRVSLVVDPAGTFAAGVGLYLVGHLVPWLAGSLGPLGWMLRLVPNLAACSFASQAAGRVPVPAHLVASSVAYLVLACAAFLYWTGAVLEARGGTA